MRLSNKSLLECFKTTTMARTKRPHEMTEKDYEAQWDAQTLAKAILIKDDKARLKAAVAWAKKQVEDEKEEAKAYEQVAAMTT